MSKTTFEPPRCPECGVNLFRVYETNREVYRFNPETGRYEEVDGEAESYCPDCDIDLYDVFPDGVCNYSPEPLLCGECGKELTEETMWSEYTCKDCAERLGLDEE